MNRINGTYPVFFVKNNIGYNGDKFLDRGFGSLIKVLGRAKILRHILDNCSCLQQIIS